MKDTQLITYTVDKLLKDSYFKRGICQISKVCSGGGGGVSSVNSKTGDVVLTASDINTSTTPSQTIQQALDGKNLQTVTNGTGNNVTSNVIQVTGMSNFNSAINSSTLSNFAGLATQLMDVNAGKQSYLLLGAEGFTFQCDNTLSLNANVNNTTPFTFYKDISASSLSTVGGADAVEDIEFVTLSQLKAGAITPNQVVTGALPSANLTPGIYYTYTGNTNISWDLPQVAGNTGTRIGIINASTNNLTINSFSGANDMNDSGNSLNTIIINPGQARILYNNSIQWYFIT